MDIPPGEIAMSKDLTPFEREILEFIRKYGEVLTTDIPGRMGGAIPSLINKGLVEIYKKRTSPWRPKKRKFLRIKEA